MQRGNAKILALPLLLLLISSIYLYTATTRAVLDDGDALYATVAKQVVERNDWVTPYSNGVRFLDKPPMMYWLMATAFHLLGINEFAARLPSVLAVLGMAILLYLMGKKHAGQTAGFIAGLASAFCVGTFLFTRMVFPDMLFVFLLTLSLHAFLEWYSDPSGPLLPAMLFYAALAGAVLTKGMIGVAFPVAIILLFLSWPRAWSRLKHFHPGKGLLLFLALALPWHILAARRNSGFLWYFFINEQVLRFLGRRQPMDYESISLPLFWALILLWLFPWSAFFPAIRPVVQEYRSKASGGWPLVWLSLSWIILVLGFFSLSSRIEHYSLPLIPPLALLVGIVLSPEKFVNEQAQNQRERWVSRGFACLAGLGAIVGAAVAAVLALWFLGAWNARLGQTDMSRHIRAYDFYFAPIFDLPPGMVAQLLRPLLGTAIAFSLGFLGAWWMNRRGRRTGGVLLLVLMMAAFSLFAYQSLGVCEDAISSRQFGQTLARLCRPGDSAITFGDFEAANSMNFYAAVPLEIYGGTAAVLSWGMRYSDAPNRILSREQFESRWNGASRTFLLAPDAQIPELHLRQSHEVLRSAGRTLLCNQHLD
jgi:4-amino-4-deoxy-L-arabinose transferase-like glycosyltransferase